MPKEVKWAISLAVGLGLLWVGWKVYFVLVTLHVLICGLLIVVVLLQSGEAADLAGAFGGAGSQTAFGPRGAATFLSKATTWCAIMFMMTSMALTMHIDTQRAPGGTSVLQQFSKPAKQSAPVAPAPAMPVPTAPVTPPAAPGPATPEPTPAPASSAPAPAPASPSPATPRSSAPKTPTPAAPATPAPSPAPASSAPAPAPASPSPDTPSSSAPATPPQTPAPAAPAPSK